MSTPKSLECLEWMSEIQSKVNHQVFACTNIIPHNHLLMIEAIETSKNLETKWTQPLKFKLI